MPLFDLDAVALGISQRLNTDLPKPKGWSDKWYQERLGATAGPPHEIFLESTKSRTELFHPHIFLSPFIDCLPCFANCKTFRAI